MSTLGCSQNNKNEKMNSIKEKVNKLEKYNNEPVYQLRINTPNSFTVFINGIPVANKYVNYLNSYLSEINSLLKEGSLTPKRLYNLTKDDYTNKKVFIHKAKFQTSPPYKLIDWREGKSIINNRSLSNV